MPTVSDLLLDIGRAKAAGELGGGQAWGNAVQQLGQIPGQTIAQMRQADEQAQAAKLRGLQVQEAQLGIDASKRQASDVGALDTAVGMGESGKLDPDAIEASLPGHLKLSFRKSWNDAEAAKTTLQKARTDAANAQDDYLGALAAGVKPFLASPDGGIGAATIALQHAKEAGFDGADQLLAQIQQNPQALPTMVESLVAKSPTQQKSMREAADLTLRQQQEQRVIKTAEQTAADRVADNTRADATATEAQRHNRAMEARPVAGAATSAALTDDGVEYAATQYRLTGKMPALGNGAGDVKAKIISQSAAQAKALGQTPATSIQKQAAYAGDAKALAKMQAASSSAEAFETKAKAQTGIISELSNKVNRTQYPALNGWILAGKADLLGDKDTQLLFNAVSTFSSEYAKIMEGSTGSASGSSDGARAAAQRLISAKLNKGTMQGTLDLMQREMDLTLQGYDATIAHITEKMGGAPAAPATPATGAAPAAPAGWKYVPKAGGGWTAVEDTGR